MIYITRINTSVFIYTDRFRFLQSIDMHFNPSSFHRRVCSNYEEKGNRIEGNGI
jgi:hypothetical protein